MIWGASEALLRLPRTHPRYERILHLFREHITGLMKYQGSHGLWHQVLDHPESYEETSCTAMFVIALARGIRHGWLDTSYAGAAWRAWDGIARQVAKDGTVSGICRGTGVGSDIEFYANRKTLPSDPRGLGAVITAGVEMQRVLDRSRGLLPARTLPEKGMAR